MVVWLLAGNAMQAVGLLLRILRWGVWHVRSATFAAAAAAVAVALAAATASVALAAAPSAAFALATTPSTI